MDKRKHKTKTLKHTSLLLFVLLILPIYALAMESPTYVVNSDVIGFSAGDGSSASYDTSETGGETGAGQSDGSQYTLYAGFWQPDEQVLAYSISPTAIDFGEFSTTTVASQNATITVTATNTQGYAIRAYDSSPDGSEYGLIDGVSTINDATTPNNYQDIPSAGIEHYGIVVTGNHAEAGYANGTKINSLNSVYLTEIGAYNSDVADDILTINFRAGIAGNTPAALAYSSNITFIMTAQF